ncbi:MAG: mechanosensitive ion channel [Bacilli bacterium]|nr:mechanosensitive ion channel [Bacilli bacterium]
MDKLEYISKIIGKYVSMDDEYILLILKSILALIILHLIKVIVNKVVRFMNNNKKEYKIIKIFNAFMAVLNVLVLLFIWDNYIKSLITFVSFVSAAVTIALRDIIFNFFCGMYISIKRPFSVEDRIEFDDIKGDVVNISAFSFELLEVNENAEDGQSTGKIISIPNSVVFTKSIKNFNKTFKYIWFEIPVRIKLDSDIKKNKSELYKIVNNIDMIKQIPTKMKKEIKTIKPNYRIYFNKFDPVIYTKVNNNKVELTIRYLVHPKMARYVESEVWNRILEEKEKGLIDLYSDAI